MIAEDGGRHQTSTAIDGLDTNALFTYRPLRSSRNIRLLHIDEGTEHDPISGSLEEIELDSPLPYYSLSYVWGSGEATQSIRIQGKVVPILPSLFEVLKKLRRDKYTPIWIDRVCISQEDDVERASQVMLMGQIYQSAKLVIIELGGEIGHGGVETIVKMFVDFYEQRKAKVGLKHDSNKYDFDPEYLCKYGLPKRGDPSWGTLRSFLEQPWFYRTWVLQEIVFATDFEVYCGQDRLEATTFLEMLQIIVLYNLERFMIFSTNSSYPSYSVYRGHLIGVYREAWQMNNVESSEQKPSLLELVINNRPSKCSNPRDHIFAFLGMARGTVFSEIPPDYKEPVAETYLRAAEHFVRSGDGAALLNQAKTALRDPNLPSWLPDWDVPQEPGDQVLATVKFRTKVSELYNTGGDRGASMEISKSASVLVVKGRTFDIISTMGAAVPEEEIQIGPTQLMAGVDELDSMLKGLSEGYPTGEDIDEVLWRTYICDRHSDLDQKAPDEYRELLPLWRIFFLCDAAAENQDLEAFRNLTAKLAPYFPDFRVPNTYEGFEELKNRTVNYQLGCLQYFARARTCLTSKGYICRAPRGVAAGDVIVVFKGVEVPYLLRPVGQNQYKLLGNCYCHGIMYGEALNEPDLEIMDIEII